ncbi:MAG TPA: L,D-transpeptidase family protein [Chitinophagaceae bacterium]|nr:L,D-transpeptidase family protein [Chitinophagaceae bacterium]
MNKYLQAVVIVLIVFTSCRAQQSKVKEVQRDTTITPATSFSKLFLDSTTLEKFIKDQNASDSDAVKLRNFYKSRNYQYAWFTEDGIAEQTRAFWNLHNNYISNFGDTALRFKNLHHEIDTLLNEDSTLKISPQQTLQTELELTKHFFEYSKHAYAGKVNSKDLEWFIPRKKIDAVVLLDSFIARDGKNLEGWEPVNVYYQHLKQELLHYYTIEKSGGWKAIESDKSKKYKRGDSALVIKQVKQRLQISGDDKSTDTSAYYKSELELVIQRMQKSFGLKEDGIITASLITALNVPVTERIRQMLINLERMRWIPQQPPGNLLLVNIPEFRLHVFDSGKKQFSMNVVVGKDGHSTVIFTDQLKYVVFSPYWNVPSSIVKNEILPAMRRNSNYLAKNNMEQTGTSNGLPVIRQKPGGDNSLGRVKFIFPNSYNIYFHDTPAKSLFNESNRAFSHGCIRLAEPLKLAEYLLRDQPEWTPEKIKEAMNASKENWVTLKKPVPVFISYFTAWVDSEGLLNFRTDIYGHDKGIAAHLFE